MAYVLADPANLQNGSKGVHIKTRGRPISMAVDTAEIVRNRFATDAKVKDGGRLREGLLGLVERSKAPSCPIQRY